MGAGSLLIANRGEIAVRIARTAAELGIPTVGVFSEDDADGLHVRMTDETRPLDGIGPAAYLDGDAILAVARDAGCDGVHPGYGFLSENAAFARAVEDAGLAFVGPSPETLELFGDKARARALAEECGVPVLPGTQGPTSLDEARAFAAEHGAIMLKAVAGGGGRGMRVVRDPDELEAAFERCASEAERAVGSPDLYVEKLLERPRHVEVQLAGDGARVVHLWERECSLQRRNQKLVELTPAPGLDPALRERILTAAVRLGEEAGLRNLATVEFLVSSGDDFAFCEVNPRLQVEHTVTEEVTDLDLVAVQLHLAAGRSLDDLGLEPSPEPRGAAMQVRVNAETVGEDGTARPASGTLAAFDPPSGPGVRTDTHAYAGYRTNPAFDSLLAKVVCRAPDYDAVLAKTYRALCELRIEGAPTNVPFLQNLLRHPDVVAGRLDTRLVTDGAAELAGPAEHPRLHPEPPSPERSRDDPLAVLAHGKSTAEAPDAAPPEAPEGTVPVSAPLHGTVVAVDVRAGEAVHAGRQLLVLEAMKMEHVVHAPAGGYVREVAVSPGDTVPDGHPLVFVEEADVAGAEAEAERAADPDRIRPDLQEALDRRAKGSDAERPEAVEKRRRRGQRTARENVEDLCDPDSFIEYGPLAIAAQRRRRSVEDLIERTPADGLIAGIGRVNGDRFDDDRARCIVISYDYTVLAGTQGFQNHRKKDRMFELAERYRLPIVFFTEGGGGRPGDTDAPGVAGLDTMAFHLYGRLSGLVPLVGINSGRCFAGNAALLGCCDVVIADESSTMGMGGPAMIEGGGLGVYRPEEVGPMRVQVPNGVVDVPVADEAEGVAVAKRYLSYFQGAVDDWESADPKLLRTLVPENRLRIYDVRRVIDTLADTGSVLELRRAYAPGMITAFARIEGRPVGIVANDPAHLAGAITSSGADKASRFMQLCDAHDVPLLFLCDTPGIMVGPEAEKTGLVRHASRMFVTGANLTVPFFTIVLRKAYGLGAQTMAGGSFKAPMFVVSWPTGEFGGMGLEGAVKLGYRKELEAIEDPDERQRVFDEMVERAYQRGKATNTASHFEFDDVIDPAESRKWIVAALRSAPPPPPRTGKKRPNVDTW